MEEQKQYDMAMFTVGLDECPTCVSGFETEIGLIYHLLQHAQTAPPGVMQGVLSEVLQQQHVAPAALRGQQNAQTPVITHGLYTEMLDQKGDHKVQPTEVYHAIPIHMLDHKVLSGLQEVQPTGLYRTLPILQQGVPVHTEMLDRKEMPKTQSSLQTQQILQPAGNVQGVLTQMIEQKKVSGQREKKPPGTFQRLPTKRLKCKQVSQLKNDQAPGTYQRLFKRVLKNCTLIKTEQASYKMLEQKRFSPLKKEQAPETSQGPNTGMLEQNRFSGQNKVQSHGIFQGLSTKMMKPKEDAVQGREKSLGTYQGLSTNIQQKKVSQLTKEQAIGTFQGVSTKTSECKKVSEQKKKPPGNFQGLLHTGVLEPEKVSDQKKQQPQETYQGIPTKTLDQKETPKAHTSSPVYQCGVCEEYFNDIMLCANHMRTHDEKRAAKCCLCDKSFASRPELAAHSDSEHWQQIMGTHKKADSEDSAETNLNQLDTTSQAASFKARDEVPKSIQLHTCDCGALFKQERKLKVHLRMVHGIDCPHKCKMCAQTFKTDRLLRNHMGKDHNEWPFICDQCGKGYILQSQLTQHFGTHTQVWKCDICEKRFNYKASLDAHRTVQTGDRAFQCEECGKTFRLQKTLLVHRKSHQPKQRKPRADSSTLYQCTECNKRFYYMRSCQAHMEMDHPVASFYEPAHNSPVSKQTLNDNTAHRKDSSRKPASSVNTANSKYSSSKPASSVNIAPASRVKIANTKDRSSESVSSHNTAHSKNTGSKRSSSENQTIPFKMKLVATSKQTLPMIPRTTPGGKTFYPCLVCLDAFPTMGGLTAHMRTHTEEEQVQAALSLKQANTV